MRKEVRRMLERREGKKVTWPSQYSVEFESENRLQKDSTEGNQPKCEFASTKDAEFILRDNQSPDLEEVTNWIEWSKQSRSLKAA